MSDAAEALCERAQKGDVAAASELVTVFYQRIFAYLRRLRMVNTLILKNGEWKLDRNSFLQ
jgi:hypothetical protein